METYSTGEAARILRVTEGRVRQMLQAGELEGTKDPVSDRWRVAQHAVHARLETRPREPRESSISAAEWLDRVEVLQRELGRLEGRLQLTESAESTMREALERERERADKLAAEVEELRARGFWARMLGR